MKVDTVLHLSPWLRRCVSLFVLPIVLLLTFYLMILGRISRAADSFLVRIHVDGTQKIIPTQATTVEEALHQADVHLDRLDMVEPGLHTPVSDAFNINVYRARPVMVVDGQRRTTITTALRSSHLVAKAAGMTVYPEDRFEETLVDDFVREQFLGEKISIIRSKAVTVHVDGNELELRTHASTLGELFREKGIALEGDDYSNVPTTSPIKDGMSAIITRVGHEVEVVEREVPFTTRTVKNYDLPYGEEQVEEKGRPGRVILSYTVTRHNGKVVQRRLLSETQAREPQERVVVLGMKPVTVYTSNAQILAALRQCETGGNYSTNTGNGYYGAYQFMISTWDRIAARYRPSLVGVRPDKASPAAQDDLVLKNAQASAGGFASQHPGCYAKLSLPKFPF